MFRPELVSFLTLLIKRSPDVGDGWRIFSEQLKGLVYANYKAYPGLFEIDYKNMRVRTTPEGDILVKWMNYTPPKV